MRALVCVKRVVDYAVHIRVASDGAGVELKNVKMAINPFCSIAVEEAVKMKEAGKLKEIVAFTAGDDKASETLRHAMAMGVDRAIHVKTVLRGDRDLQPLAVAKLIQQLVLREQANLVMLGKQSIDDDCNQTGQLVAGLLGWPQATFCSKRSTAD